MAKDLTYYMGLNYSVELDRAEEKDGIVVAFHPDLPGCIAQGSTANEALANLDEARAAWIEDGLEDHLLIPEPQEENYSGKILVRMKPALHAAIARRARRQNVSVTHYIVTTLAESVGIGTVLDYMGQVREELQAVAAQSRLTARQTSPPKLLGAYSQPPQEDIFGSRFGKRGTH